ncbi:nucleoside-diphosphate-sugar epimerase family protein [Microthyrium microscopicum]|uniref:Nucleoside-diphosphate-sugar epimerase family protein n=1 Tax=Microthyrium microscopicum TaxID=703497 RepID=A0A6A6U2N5_9PEZI|nr:nucleoside-diphosphate-sugar epimerase family protein [Microthyrium microscopicum]
MSKPILVLGATGKQGGALITALLASPKASSYLLLAVTRNATSPTAQKLAAKHGVKLVQGDMNDIPALFEAAKEVAGAPLWGVFSVQVSNGTGSELEEAYGKGLVDAALDSSVKMFVYTSVERGGEEKSWENATEIRHFVTKYNIEHYLRDKAGETMQWAILRPTAFMDNWNVGFLPRIFAAIWKLENPTKPLQLICSKDIGIFASLVFLEPDKFNHKAIGLAGDELSYPEFCEVYKSKTGQDLPEGYGFMARGVLFMLSEVKVMFQWFKTDGYKADIPALKEMHPGLLTWGEWVEKESDHETKK